MKTSPGLTILMLLLSLTALMLSNAMLFKVRGFVNIKDSKINLLCYLQLSIKLCKHSLWSKEKFDESTNHTTKKALSIMSFECRNAHSNPFRHEK